MLSLAFLPGIFPVTSSQGRGSGKWVVVSVSSWEGWGEKRLEMKKRWLCSPSAVLASALCHRACCQCPHVDPIMNPPLYPFPPEFFSGLSKKQQNPYSPWRVENWLESLSWGSISLWLPWGVTSVCRVTTPTSWRIQKTTSRCSFPPQDGSWRGQCYQCPQLVMGSLPLPTNCCQHNRHLSQADPSFLFLKGL